MTAGESSLPTALLIIDVQESMFGPDRNRRFIAQTRLSRTLPP